MQNLTQLIELLSELTTSGMLGMAGGSVAIRTSRGVFVSSADAAVACRWKMTQDDFVLFPGETDASMAKAGRRATRDSKLHRAVLNSRHDWHISLITHAPGLLSFASGGREMPVPSGHAALFQRGRDFMLPLCSGEHDSEQQASSCAAIMQDQFANLRQGGAILSGRGALIAGDDIATTISVAMRLENCALAQQYLLSS